MMRQTIFDFAKDALQTGFRLAPWPAEPGFREIGKPGPLSPVLVTCNFDFTVRRVMRAMRDNDEWLVVAPSSGINVWCAASGGHLSTHQVVTALKTSARPSGWRCDYSGSTPIEGGSHFKEARWHITLDAERCKGVYFCWQVCPEACFEKREDVRKVEIVHSDRCIRCGACVVQCPTDALSFEDERSRIEPATIRRFKLNLLGQRTVDAGVLGSDGEGTALSALCVSRTSVDISQSGSE
jgi:ferredoxin